MNIVLFDDKDTIDSTSPRDVIVRDKRALHIQNILKLVPGSKFRVGRIGEPGKIGTAQIVESTPDTVRFHLIDLSNDPPAPSPVELILALPRPKSLKRCLRAVANLGIKSIHLIHSIRVEKSYWTAPALNPDILRETLLEGLSIAGDTHLPTVRLHRLFKPFVQDVAPHLVVSDAYVAHPERTGNVRSTISISSAPIPVAIGPEGGFSDYEVGLFHEAGFKNLSLGSRIYSVECAVPVIDSMIRAQQS